MADPYLEDHEGGITLDGSTPIQTIVDVRTCIIGSKIKKTLKSFLKNKESKCGPSKLVVYSQWNQFLDFIGMVFSHNSILSAQIDGKIMARGQEKALEKFLNNP
ncbi:hypothetical protein O181_013360 [Austropuccinia psidii MF-1]|uniref:Uncharacterized protein n=1 Tax=Austropuccinia psidii MF-1 TaxID=1389203 RepID=A0A9Q3BYV5_9BASI|nr:hypothetical protein [Austropuccinia psidii MF-1]